MKNWVNATGEFPVVSEDDMLRKNISEAQNIRASDGLVTRTVAGYRYSANVGRLGLCENVLVGWMQTK